jgi:hypothetical protein
LSLIRRYLQLKKGFVNCVMKERIRYILLIILAYCFFQTDSYATGKYQLVYPNGKATKIYSSNFNNREYISLSHIYSLLFRKYSYTAKHNEIHGKDFRLRATAGSFYILLEKNQQIKIAQMIAPAINVNKMLYLPLESFFMSLPALGLYYTEMHGYRIILRDDDKTVPKQKPISEKTYEGTFSDFDTNDEEDFSYFDEEKIDNDFLKIDEYDEIDDDSDHLDESNHIDDDFRDIEDQSIDIEDKSARRGQSTQFDDLTNYESTKEYDHTDSNFEKIVAPKHDITYSEPALKFSFLYSANYLREGFKNIPENKARIVKKKTSERKADKIKHEENIPSKENDRSDEIKDHKTSSSPLFPPNVYVLPENLIRRELNK